MTPRPQRTSGTVCALCYLPLENGPRKDGHVCPKTFSECCSDLLEALGDLARAIWRALTL